MTDQPERTLRILADLEELIVTWFRYEPGQKGPDPHVHHHHTDAFYVPGIWVQLSHLEIEYYEKFYKPELFTRQAAHAATWGE